MELPICIEIPPLEDPFKLTLPGGIEIERIDVLEIVQPETAQHSHTDYCLNTLSSAALNGWARAATAS